MKQQLELITKPELKLAITPELRQSLSILQMSVLELETYINQQLQENVLLEESSLPGQDIDTEEVYEEESILAESSIINKRSKEPIINHYSTELEITDSKAIDDGFRKTNSEDITAVSFENLIEWIPTLHDYLIEQLHITVKVDHEKKIGELLINNIDEDGYFRNDLAEVADILKVKVEEAEELLHLIQKFDPPGVGARDLQECLYTQVIIRRDSGEYTQLSEENFFKLVIELVENYLYDIAEGRYSKISNRSGRRLHDVLNAINFIKTLDPKPGRNFGSFNGNRFLFPDIITKKIENNYVIIINEPANTRLSLNPINQKIYLEQSANDATVVSYIKEKQRAAYQLIKAIEQRRLTLYRISEVIVAFQQDFMENGLKDLKPLTLHQVAQTIGLHESTVSRTIAGKYMETPRGIYPLKYFFTTALNTKLGETVSTEIIKKQIKTIIAKENPNFPLSDEQLVKILRDNEIMISRRTVAKYREENQIPASNKRRR